MKLDKNTIFIEGKRNGYAPDQCGKTITAGELIRFLEDYDEDTPVYLKNDNGYTYGNITERSIEWQEAEEDEVEEDEDEEGEKDNG